MIFDHEPILENDYIILRKPELKDASRLTLMKSEKEVYQYLPTFLPELKYEDDELFITQGCEEYRKNQEGMILGIYLKSDSDTFIGIAELYGYVERRNKVSIGYRIMKEYWHRHIATNTVALLKDYILNDLKLTKITAHIIADNTGSIRSVINNGFVQRRKVHLEDWGQKESVLAIKYVVYTDEEGEIL